MDILLAIARRHPRSVPTKLPAEREDIVDPTLPSPSAPGRESKAQVPDCPSSTTKQTEFLASQALGIKHHMRTCQIVLAAPLQYGS